MSLKPTTRIVRNLLALAITGALVVACGGGGGGGGAPSPPPPPPPPPEPAVDTDNDGLTDEDERTLYGTSPSIADTDGDGESDGREIVELGFDETVNPYRYNPLVADLPQVTIDIQATPTIGAIYTDTNGSTQTSETTRSQSQTTSTSTTFGTDVTIGVEATTSATVGGSSLQGPSAQVSNSVSVSTETTVSFDETNTTENQTAWSEMQSQGIEQSTTTTGGYMRVTVRLSHAGHIGYTIQSLTLTATQASDGADPFISLGTLDFDGNQAWQPVSLGPLTSTQTGPLLFEKTDFDVGTIRTLLTQSRSVTIEPGTIELVDANGQPFAFQEAEIASRTAKVLIDYGPYGVTELYQVATNSDPISPGRTLSAILADILVIDYTESGGLDTVRASENPIPATSTGRWVVTSKRNTGTAYETTFYDPMVESYTVDDIDVRAGDEVLLVYLEDADNDGIGYREELIHGTDPGNDDTDGDGLTDDVEIRESWTVNAISQTNPNRYPAKVFSSPLAADYDGDGLDDPGEKANGTDPYNPDTDGDGESDLTDQDNGGTAIYSDLSIDFGQLLGAIDTPTTVRVEGSITANAPRVIAEATLDWQSDGTADVTRNAASGGNPTLLIDPQKFDYAAPGSYTITVDAADDGEPQSTLRRQAQVELTGASRPLSSAWGYDGGLRHGLDLRRVVDLDQDGFDDVVVIGEATTEVALGSAAGPQTPAVWATDSWGRGPNGGYAGVDTDPRFFVDLDADNDLDIVGIRASDNTVRYGLNNGSGFEPPVEWIAGLGWNAALDHAFLADVDGNGIVDFVHVPSNGNAVVYRTLNFALDLAAPVTDSQALIDANRVNFPVRAADLDGDGCPDIVVFSRSETSYKRSTCDGSGQFEARQQLYSGLAYNNGYRVPIHVREVVDMTNDGLPDLVAFANTITFVVPNMSTPGSVQFGGTSITTEYFVASQGWATEKLVGGEYSFNVHPRYLADVNNDGYLDIVGYASAGAAIGVNMLGIDGESRFADVTVIAPEFSISEADTEWYEAYTGCPQSTTCREYFPRMVGDVNGDGRADLVGFDQDDLVYQPIPYVTQFQ